MIAVDFPEVGMTRGLILTHLPGESTGSLSASAVATTVVYFFVRRFAAGGAEEPVEDEQEH